MLTTLTRWYEPVEILKMATSVNGELLAMSGPRNPYPGRLGVIEEGALADLILVDGDPIADIGLIADPEKNFVLIMKDGRVVKDALPALAVVKGRRDRQFPVTGKNPANSPLFGRSTENPSGKARTISVSSTKIP